MMRTKEIDCYLNECFIAEMAFERSLACMCFIMVVQIAALNESFTAYFAFEWPLARCCSDRIFYGIYCIRTVARPYVCDYVFSDRCYE
ncbi:DDB1- and CUL4-associated factor 4-like protein [Dirofilaria immitis]